MQFVAFLFEVVPKLVQDTDADITSEVTRDERSENHSHEKRNLATFGLPRNHTTGEPVHDGKIASPAWSRKAVYGQNSSTTDG